MQVTTKVALVVGALSVLLMVTSMGSITRASLFASNQQQKAQAGEEHGSFMDTMTEGLSNIADQVQHTISDTLQASTPEAILHSAEKDVDTFEGQITATVNNLLSKADAIRDKYAQADRSEWPDELKKKAKELERRLRWRATSLLNLQKSFRWNTDYVQDFMDDVREAALMQAHNIADWTQEETEAGKKFAQEKLHKLADWTQQETQAGQKLAREKAKELSEKFPALLDASRAEMKRRLSRENLAETWQEAEHAVETAAKSVWESEPSTAARQRVNDILHNGSDFARGVYSDVRDLMEKAKEKGKDEQQAIADASAQLSDFLSMQAKHTRSTVVEPLLSKLSSVSEDVCEEAQEEYSRAEDAVRELMSKFDPETRAQCGLEPDNMLDLADFKARQAKEAFVDKAQEMKETVAEKAEKAKETAKETAKDTASQARLKLREAGKHATAEN